jgi:hypothetical protein
MTNSIHELRYGVWWFKMPIVHHPKSFVTNPKWFWGMIKSGLKMFWLDVKKTRLRVKLYRLTDVEYYHLPRTEEPKHEPYK